MNLNDQKKDNFAKQFSAGLVLFVMLLMIGVFLFQYAPIIAFFWLSGLGFGYILQRSRFCSSVPGSRLNRQHRCNPWGAGGTGLDNHRFYCGQIFLSPH